METKELWQMEKNDLATALAAKTHDQLIKTLRGIDQENLLKMYFKLGGTVNHEGFKKKDIDIPICLEIRNVIIHRFHGKYFLGIWKQKFCDGKITCHGQPFNE